VRPAGGPGGGGITEDLARTAAGMRLTGPQQDAFDAAVEAIQQRQLARQSQPQPQGGNVLFGGGRGMGGPRIVMGESGGDMAVQMRQRMAQRFQQDFAAFRALLDETQRTTWDVALGALLNARRAPVYKLVDGTPQMAMVRIGASDGTDTEISGNVQEGDELVTGERAAQAATPAAP